MADTTVKVNFVGDESDLKRATKGANDSLEAVDKKASSAFGSIGKAAIGAAAGVGVLSVGSDLLNLGTQLDVIDKKSKTVFEGSIGTVDAWAKANASAFGQTDDQLKGLAANFGDLLKPMGFTATQAADMSTKVVGLSGALSAWSGGTVSAAGASDILAKAMLGERDGLKSLGISILDADVQARLLKNGTDKLTGSALEQAKAVATQELIFEKSADAQKAWADGSFDAIQKQNALKERIAELKEQLAERLLPAFQAVTAYIVDKVIPAVQSIVQWMKEHKEIVTAVAAVVAVVLVAAFLAWAASAAAAATSTLVAMAPLIAIVAVIAAVVAAVIYAYTHWDWFRNTVDAVASFITGTLVPAFQEIWAFIRDKVIPIVTDIITKFVEFQTKVFDVATKVSAALVSVFEAIKAPIEAAAKFVLDKIDTMLGPIDEVIGKISKLPGFQGDAFGGLIDKAKAAGAGGGSSSMTAILTVDGAVITKAQIDQDRKYN